MTETTERFLREIAERIGRDAVAELYLFPAIRQGGMESGIAVVGAKPAVSAESDDGANDRAGGAESEAAEDESVQAVAVEDGAEDDADAGEGIEDRADDGEVETDGEVVAEDEIVEELDEDVDDHDAEDGAEGEAEPVAAQADDEVDPYADEEDVEAAEGESDEQSDDEVSGELSDLDMTGDEVSGDDADAPAAPIERHVIYTARYRYVMKGPDRGKWEMDVKAEADAPLITMDEVVRGVVHRSGDEAHPERLSGETFRELVPQPAAPPSAPASPAPADTPQPDSAAA